MRSIVPLVCAVLTFFCNVQECVAAGTNSVDRRIKILNESGRKVEVYWIHPQTNELVLTSKPYIHNGADFFLDSYVGHSFELQELPSSKTGRCGYAKLESRKCRKGYFTVNNNEDQVIHVGQTATSLEVKHEDNKSIARDEASSIIDRCKMKARESLGNDTCPEGAVNALEDLTACVEASISSKLEKSTEEMSFQAKIRTRMGDLFETYTCSDDALNTTESIETKQWENGGVTYDVEVLHERPASKIHILKNFISEEECRAVEEVASPVLHRATVADGKGGSQYSENRKAMQADIRVPWDKEAEGNPIAALSRRVYEYAENILNLGIKEHGQESLMSIQYKGRGEEEKEPDRYKPHCDGECKGLPHKPGTRVATMVMYCTVPDRGGATNFKNAGIHVVPEKGTATFFSYINPDNMKMDTGFTEHSGCPVVEGEKKIVTQWIRLGVDKQNPWNSFNTLGLKLSDVADQ